MQNAQQTTSVTKEMASTFLRENIGNLVGANIRKYTWRTCTDEPNINSMVGQVQLTPSTGKVVLMDTNLTIIKESPNHFTVVANHLLDKPVNVGDKIKATFYQLRRFDGTAADGSEDASVGGGCTITLTGTETKFPVKWNDRYLGINARFADDYTTVSNPYLQDLIVQMEKLPVNNDRRKVVNILVDANAQNLRFADPGEDDLFTNPPAVRVDVATAKFTGEVAIVYDRGMDTYSIVLTPPGGEPIRQDDVHFNELGEVLIKAIDDGSWKKAKVEIIQAAPKPRKAKTETA